MRITPRTAGAALVAPLRRGWRQLSRSLLLRVVATTLALGLGAVGLLGAVVTTEIRDGLVLTRVERILAESARDAVSFQNQIDAAPAATPGERQQLVSDLLESTQLVGGDSRGLVLLQAPDNTVGIPLGNVSSTPELVRVITPDMRAAIQEGNPQPWQYTQMPQTQEPGVVVGSALEVEDAGAYELYFVYSLEDERQTLLLIQRVLAFGAGVLVGLVVLLTWSVTLQAVRPVRHAARVASRLAEGRLSERMKVRGRDEMATLASTFNEMAESLQRQITRMEELSRLQRRFVSDVSHELRTPLTTVRMASDVLYDARGDFPPAVARSAELLSTQLDRFEALLSDLLEISRMDAGAAQLEFEDMNLADVVRDEVEAMAPVAQGMDVQMRLWVAPGEHVASMDRPRVGRIVRNLLANAVEHAQATAVDVAVASNQRGVAVVVRDYGGGLTPQQVQRVFDRFWRADAARTRTMGGTGLGLSIAREDAQLHDGRLEAWGSPGTGASFRLMLPCTSRGLGTQDALPVVLREDDFPQVGEQVPLPVIDDVQVQS